MSTTSIEWTDTTWNPVVGCTWASPGCDHCYAARMTRRLEAMGNPDYRGLSSRKHFNGKLRTLEHRLEDPLHWKKPRMVFVNSMSDLFHEKVPFEFVDRVFAVMALCPQHTFQILTKRPERMAEYFSRHFTRHKIAAAALELGGTPGTGANQERCDPKICNAAFPYVNVWLGVSVENRAVLHRIDTLREIPAAVRFLSIEPLLEDLGEIDLTGIHWVIVGGESGPNARPMHPDWARSIRDQCQAAKVPYFFKQHGEWISKPQIADINRETGWEVRPEWRDAITGKPWGCLASTGVFGPQTTTWNGRQNDPQDDCEVTIYRVGKKAAGRMLDGRTWDEMPTRQPIGATP